jgi:hypothetical protein
VKVRTLYGAPTVRELAAHVDALEPVASDA